MTSNERKDNSLSAAFFCPQSKAPDEDYLNGLHLFLRHNKYGRSLLQEISDLEKTWTIFANARKDVQSLSQGLAFVRILQDWAICGESSSLASARSGIVALPLLVILQIGQYLCYLEFHDLSHLEFTAQIRNAGGAQGYCGGLPSAIAIACAQDEMEVVKNTGIAMRILLGIGAYGEAVDDTYRTGSTTLALRLKYEGQGDDLTRYFPKTHVSAITDPKSVSIVGPAVELDKLVVFACEQGIQVQMMDIRGKVHHPENENIAAELSLLCTSTPSLQLPDASELQVSVRSNISGDQLLHGSLTKEIIMTILASRCDWYKLLSEVAEDLNASTRLAHKFVIFGLNDCVPMSPFHKKRLQAVKSEAHNLIRRIRKPRLNDRRHLDFPFFQDSAIAVIGASCRLPGASNLDDLWNLMAGGSDCHQEISKDRFDIHGSFRASQSGGFATGRKFFGNFLDDIQAFDNSFFGINAREAANMDPQQRLLLELSFEALEASGYLSTHHRESGDNVGCFIGASLVEYLDNTNAHGPTAYTSTGTIRAFLSGRLSYYYGWRGPSEIIDTACSSSLVAINRACKAIQSGECGMALAGGINIITGINNYLDLGKAGFLNSTGQCKPFDKSADGYCRSDGAGLVVLKKLKQAISDGDQVLGIIPGIATNQGGLSASITVPDSAAQQILYRTVIQQAGLQCEDVTYIEAHGTGTQAGDPLEMESVRSIFGSSSRSDMVYVGSIKGNIGHCETAAGVAGLLKVLAMIKHGKIPPQTNHYELNPKIAILEPDHLGISQSLRTWDVPFRVALVNSYGAAGSNCALLCCEVPLDENKRVKETRNSPISFPLIFSAASRKSLLDYIRVVGDYLANESDSLDIGDISYTLNERRRQHKYHISMTSASTKDLSKQLLSCEPSSVVEFQPNPRPVVLCFSGQNSSKIALDKRFFENYPIFRSYINNCDTTIKSLGFHSIIPAIFQAEPIEDIATLQCSIFAMQYACAKCWIEAGLNIRAIIGHSLGELTALAVSGVLSLRDSIKLVASRGRLIQTRWGLEKGAMLALQCDTKEFENISSQLQEHGDFKIACYNAPTSLIAVGTLSVIEAAEKLLTGQSSLQKIRFQRLDTSHGFHSALVEPILADLDEVSMSLQWNEPRIPLEVCAAEHLRSVREYSVSRHAREPVFFSSAVRRLEESLGACLWLEAGINTPIIPMVRKACRNPEAMGFYAMKGRSDLDPYSTVNNVVSDLVKKGVFSTPWIFLPKSARNYNQIWLPPYQFEKFSHWRENIDRALEMQQKLSATIPSSLVGKELPSPPQLVTKRETTIEHPGVSEFLINTRSQRFVKIVGGHAVCKKPLCPASMYMECIVMAIQLLIKDTGKSSLVFKSFDFHTALGLVPEGEVTIQVEEITSEWSWKFIIRSTSPSGKQISHGNGIIALVLNPSLDTFRRLVSGSIEQIEKKQDVEKLMSKRAYALFASVVNYDDFFRGIHSLTLDHWEAVATIDIPVNQPNREESTSWYNCDAVVIDAFIQVVGLLINSSDYVASEEVMVMIGIERAVISPVCKMDDPKNWRVYAKFCLTHDSHFTGDVFVFAPEGDLVAMFCGCRFTKILVSKLVRALDSANAKGPKIHTSDNGILSSSSTTTESIITPNKITPVQNNNDAALKALIAEYTGMNSSEIPADKTFVDLGLDSLASIDLVAELSSKFELVIKFEDLLISTLDDINRGLAISGVSTTGSRQCEPSVHSNPPSNDQLLLELSDHESAERHQQFLQILVEISGIKLDDIKEHQALADLGVDSLSSIDLKQELEESFSVQLGENILDCTVNDLKQQLNIKEPNLHNPGVSNNFVRTAKSISRSISAPNQSEGIVLPNPFAALKESDTYFETSAKNQGFLHYWSDVAPFQDELMLACIVECFCCLGADLPNISPGSNIPQVPHLVPRYDKLVQRLWEILQKHNIVTINQEGILVRGTRHIDMKPYSQLVEDFRTRFSSYEYETDLINLTGPKLADCLSGKEDPVAIMFGSPGSLKIMENFYSQSPMMSTLTEQLVLFLTTLLRGMKPGRPVRILEVGAGTGGTTKRLVEALDSANISAEYTFTDISPSLVTKARNKFKNYSWLEFATFNLEKEVPSTFRNRFDIVVSANCVHATMNRTASCRRLKEVLTQEGLLVLSEVTRIIDWYDICFGLLDGWWLAEGRTAYPLQPAEAWMSIFDAAGFTSTSYSQGPTIEANSQQLLVACCKQWDAASSTKSNSNILADRTVSYDLKTVVYKEVNDIRIHADVFFPERSSTSPMPVALMIHGGGHMTLSRKAIRPSQTRYLLANGYLPVSIDYRLCPEVNLVEGPIADVFDAYQWIRNILPQIALQLGFVVDHSKVVVIGWSTGGQLAMSIGWTATMAGIPPPTAVLSFYSPTDFESGELDEKRLPGLPSRTMSLERIISGLPKKQITNYDSVEIDKTNLGWVRPGDPRSELVLSLFKEGIGLPLVLKGLPDPGIPESEWFTPPSPEEVVAISPVAQVRRGTYNVPTFVIHGTCDQIAPFAAAERFVAELRNKNIRHGFLPLPGVDHIHDLNLKPGSMEWEAKVEPGYQFLFEIVKGSYLNDNANITN